VNVLRYGDADLQAAVPLDTPDVTAAEVLRDVERLMEYVARTPHAVAVAAPQLGIRRRLYVVRERDDDLSVWHNPTLTPVGLRTKVEREGCLSFHPSTYFVRRALCVRVRAQDVLGDVVDGLHHGYNARIHQHEYDHLEGVLINDRGRRAP
jgi:peptide deformylase